MRFKIGKISMVVGAMLGSVSAYAAAQTTLEVGPTLGYYLPTGHFDQPTMYVVGLPNKPSDLRGPAVGAEAVAWFGRRIGAKVGGALAYSTPSDVVATPAGPRGPSHARLAMGTAQLLVSVSPASSAGRIWVGAGAGMIHHGGDAYAFEKTPTDAAGVASAGVVTRPWHRIQGTFGASTMFYRLRLDPVGRTNAAQDVLEQGTRADVLLNFGLTIRGG